MGWCADESSGESPGLFERIMMRRRARIAVTDIYAVSTAGFGYTALQDTRMTPLIYRAPVVAANIQSLIYRPKALILFSIPAYFAYPITPKSIAGEEAYYVMRGTVDLAYLRQFQRAPLALGGGVMFTAGARLQSSLGNSATNVDFIASVFPTLRWEDDFSLLKRPAIWHIQATVPIYSFVTRLPAYNLPMVGPQIIWAFPWRFYRVRIKAGISRLLQHSEENRLNIEYSYDFYGLSVKDSTHRLALGLHTLTVGYAMKRM